MKKNIKKIVKLFLAFAIMFVELAPSFIVFADNQLPSLDVSFRVNDTGDYTVINQSVTIDHSNVVPITKYNFKINALNLEDLDSYNVKIKYDFYGAWQSSDSITPDDSELKSSPYTGAILENGITFDFDLSSTNMFDKAKNGVYKITYIVEDDNSIEIINKSVNLNVIGYKTGIDITSINYNDNTETEVSMVDGLYDLDYAKGNAKVNVSLDLGDVNPNGFFTVVQSINGLQYFDKVVADYSELESIVSFPLTYTNAVDGLYTYNISFYSNDNKLVLSKDIKFKVKNSTLLTGTTLNDYLNDGTNILMDRLVVFSSLDENTKATITNRAAIEKALTEYNSKTFDAALNSENYGMTFDSYKEVKKADIAIMEGIKAKIGNSGVIPTVDELINKLKLAYRYKITDPANWNNDINYTPVTDLINFMNVTILNREGEEALGTDILETGMKVLITIYGRELSYNIVIKGNVVSEDGKLNNSDVLEAIDLAIGTSTLGLEYYYAADVDRNDAINDSIGVNVLDISQLNYMIDNNLQTINNSPIMVNDDILASIESSKSSLRDGDKFELSFKLSGFNDVSNDADVINGIQGKLNYDKNLVKLSSVNVNSNYSWDGNINTIFGADFGKFLYAGNEASKINSDSILVTFTFEAIGVGDATIVIEDLIGTYNGMKYDLANNLGKTNEVDVEILRKLSDNNNIKKLTFNSGKLNKQFNSDELNYTLYVTHTLNELKIDGSLVSEYAKTNSFKTYQLNDDVTYIKLNVTSETNSEKTYTIKVVKVDYRSKNNYLSSLIIEGQEINFNKLKNDYEFTVENDVSSLNVTAISESENAVVTIVGNNDLKDGLNVIKITVKAENEDVREYVVNVTRKAKEVVEEPQENETTKILIIVLIIATLSGLSYLLFSDNNKNKSLNNFLDDEPVLSRKIENPKSEQNNNNNKNYNNQKNNKKKK